MNEYEGENLALEFTATSDVDRVVARRRGEKG